MNEILFSVIMPTYNSESTIDMALKSIRTQDFPQENIEILVIDGGSQDKTLDIAQNYDAVIYKNEKKFPEYAKRIGFEKARGKWIIMQDSDEVLTDCLQLQKRKEFFVKNPNVYCLLPDICIPGENCGIACAYINWFGDPFSYIVYRLSDSRVKSQRKNLYKTTENGNVYQYKINDIFPIGDGGTTTINIEKAKEVFKEQYYTQEFTVSIFYNMVKETAYVGCIPGDNIIHYSVSTFNAYLKKLHFRVHTNLNDTAQAGYTVRAAQNKKLKKRKIYFILYVSTIILPMLDSLRMAIRYKRFSLLLHFIYTYYLVWIMLVEIIRKMFHIKNKDILYGK